MTNTGLITDKEWLILASVILGNCTCDETAIPCPCAVTLKERAPWLIWARRNRDVRIAEEKEAWRADTPS